MTQYYNVSRRGACVLPPATGGLAVGSIIDCRGMGKPNRVYAPAFNARIDEIVPEVPGGAHVSAERQAAVLGDVLERQLFELEALKPELLVAARYERFRRMGRFS